MAWFDEILDSLASADRWGYRSGDASAAEPAALAALALLGHGRAGDAAKPLDALLKLQDRTGAVGIYQGAADPHWGTAHAIIAWSAAINGNTQSADLKDRLQAAAVRGCEFILSIRGTKIPKTDEVSHNTTLVGWPWVEGTHSWLEPTAMCYLALRAASMQAHPRGPEAVRLMIDRLLPDGGCNYGNTFVLGQTLRPHIQPTGIVMLALAGTDSQDPRIGKSLSWLDSELNAETTTASLSYGLLALAAHDRERTDASKLLEAALKKPTSSLGAALPRRTLAALAVLGKRSPLTTLGLQQAAETNQRP